MPVILAQQPYSKRDIPPEYDRAWFATELGNIQRAIPKNAVTRVTTASFTPTVQDRTLLIDTTTGAVTIRLPAPSRVAGLLLTVKKVAGAAAVTLLGTVDATVNPTLGALYAGITIQSDGTQWLNLGTVP
jgi:hypothetical protein